jgi:hypothetical protein
MVYPAQKERVFKLAHARKQTAAELLDDLVTMATMPAAELKRILEAGPQPHAEASKAGVTVAEQAASERETAREVEIAEEREV